MAGMLLIGLNLDWDQSKLRQKRQAFLVNFKRHLSGRRATCTHCVYVADQHPPPPLPGDCGHAELLGSAIAWLGIGSNKGLTLLQLHVLLHVRVCVSLRRVHLYTCTMYSMYIHTCNNGGVITYTYYICDVHVVLRVCVIAKGIFLYMYSVCT